MKKAIVISQGDELISGQILDTNTSYICQQLWNAGIEIQETRCIPDDINSLAHCFIECAHKADLIISTGGLGPTEDDYSAAAAAQAFELPLQQNKRALQQIHETYQKRNRQTPPIAHKMSLLPKTALPLKNPIGTAPGFMIQYQYTRCFFFPGVPKEMQAMFALHIQPLLPVCQTPHIIHLETVGMGESALANKLQVLQHPNLRISYRASRKGNTVKLCFLNKKIDEEIVSQAKYLLKDVFYSGSESDLAKVVGQMLAQHQHTVALAESCTAGRITAWLASVPGASRYLLEGAIVYSNEAKTRTCNVPSSMLESYGAVSPQVAKQLAKGIQQRANSTWGIGVSGIAGPAGGSTEKPVGTVDIAIAGPTEIIHKRFGFHGTREQIMESAAANALFMLLRAQQKTLQ